jgi:predicted nuclease with TOPRIM domain
LLISEYPNAIAEASLDCLQAAYNVESLERSLSEIEGRVDAAIAFDDNLKNELQRRAQRVQVLSQDPAYPGIQKDLLSSRILRQHAQIRRERLEREFSIAKLTLRAAIAERENQNATQP